MTTLKMPGLAQPLPIVSIVWIEGDGNYAWVHGPDQHRWLVAQTLKWFEDRLSHFVRVHKSSLINPAHVRQFEQLNLREAQVILTNGTTLLVARRRAGGVGERLKRVI